MFVKSDANKKLAYYLLKLHLHHFSKIKNQKKSQNSKNQGCSYYFCLLIEGFGSGSIPLTNGSESGRVDPDPDSDTDRNESTNVPISKLRSKTKPKHFDVFQNLNWNVSIYSKNFGTKPKLFDVFQLIFCKSKFLFFPKILEQNQNFLMCSNFVFSKIKTLLFNPKYFRSFNIFLNILISIFQNKKNYMRIGF
jgi:hypothetical protein